MEYIKRWAAWRKFLRIKASTPPGSLLAGLVVMRDYGPEMLEKIMEKYKKKYPELFKAEQEALELDELTDREGKGEGWLSG